MSAHCCLSSSFCCHPYSMVSLVRLLLSTASPPLFVSPLLSLSLILAVCGVSQPIWSAFCFCRRSSSIRCSLCCSWLLFFTFVCLLSFVSSPLFLQFGDRINCSIHCCLSSSFSCHLYSGLTPSLHHILTLFCLSPFLSFSLIFSLSCSVW